MSLVVDHGLSVLHYILSNQARFATNLQLCRWRWQVRFAMDRKVLAVRTCSLYQVLGCPFSPRKKLLRPFTTTNCCYWKALAVLRSGMFVFGTKKRYVVFFCQFIGNHCVCRNLTAHEYTVRCQICCLSRASGVIVVVSGPSMVSVVFRLVRSWLFCNSAFWLRLFVTRFWLADVG